MDVKIPAVNKSKIVQQQDDQINDNNDAHVDDADYYEELYQQEKISEYSDATVTMIQKTFLEYVDRKSLTICEYLTTEDLKSFLGYS
jgi:hypothetical protein